MRRFIILIALIFFVIAGGVYLRKTPPPPTPPNSSEEGTTTSTDPTAGWETYSNKTYGYSFKYPSDWSTENDTGAPYHGPPEGATVSRSWGPSDYCSFQVWISSFNYSDELESFVEIQKRDKEILEMSGFRAVKVFVDQPELAQAVYLATAPDEHYRISYNRGSDTAHHEDCAELFDLFLPTFTFADQSE